MWRVQWGGSKNNGICDLDGVAYAYSHPPGAAHAEPYLALMTERTICDKKNFKVGVELGDALLSVARSWQIVATALVMRTP